MKLWLDDVREPWRFGCIGWTWVKTYDEALAAFRTRTVTEASLDHDLAWEHYPGSDVQPADYQDQPADYQEKTGYDVLLWLEEHDEYWPERGVHIHTMNPAGRVRMQAVIDRRRRRILDAMVKAEIENGTYELMPPEGDEDAER